MAHFHIPARVAEERRRFRTRWGLGDELCRVASTSALYNQRESIKNLVTRLCLPLELCLPLGSAASPSRCLPFLPLKALFAYFPACLCPLGSGREPSLPGGPFLGEYGQGLLLQNLVVIILLVSFPLKLFPPSLAVFTVCALSSLQSSPGRKVSENSTHTAVLTVSLGVKKQKREKPKGQCLSL